MQERICYYVKLLNNLIWDPIVVLFVIVGVVSTIALRFVQFRYFFKSWQLVLAPQEKKKEGDKEDSLSPFQAFVNALSTSIGNGSLAGMATAVHEGGPGAVFWIFVLGIFALPIRFCEVYLSSAYSDSGASVTTGGPMAYLKKVPGGFILPAFYAIFCLLLSFAAGDAVQVNSITCGLKSIINIDSYIIAALLFAFVAYIMLGGAARIIKFSMALVPFKVVIFFVSTLLLLIYHSSALIEAFRIIVISAFEPQAIKGAILGTTMQSAIRYGLSRSVNASEAGLGIAAVFFGSAGNKNPVENGIMSMVSAFISNYLVCFVLALIVVLTGVWNHEATGIALTSEAFATFYGSFANWLITLLSIIFGMSVLVGYAYIGRECWSYLTKGRYLWVYSILYSVLAFFSSIAKVQLVWDSIDLVNAGLIAINLYGILYLMPKIRKAIVEYGNAR
ncbi:alanine/glycine:cation symporter family protein [Candidatus Babela massiliensis]|uniref:Na+/alanine symporter n=1 Tax=Candidatus Babela massiliensis TaxID=673862 RepID=V6DI43_9BACT|nr:amino acid carrier protein [Candidatus Babela massiliensis]CDK30603.1 Na+/alanine symporter [Candidatus Babela massiliensis]